MNSRLSNLYRRYTRRGAVALPSAEALAAAVEGEPSEQTERLLAEAARSGVHADLLRFARALAPESARLGVELERALDADSAAHRRGRPAPQRHATGRRDIARIVAACAACLVVALAVLAWRRDNVDDAALAAASARPDRIFVNTDQAAASRPDRIFTDAMHGDQIFKGKFSGG